ncbi:MAG: hypothetical protein M1832_000160 [Thelocarpon impressellum]|nr:MAG: hypothetical protein M1832_000160 [Thelocarpon impressellum]
MSEYWKSTPKYWCKHCKTYVRDTKIEKQNHEATPKHQGNLKRFLRDLHRGHEREERDQERAKQEVDRLNGVVTGKTTSSPGPSAASKKYPQQSRPAPPPQRQATAEERKRQIAQLAEMGVSVPDEFRGEMAMSGEWQTISETPMWSAKEENDHDEKPGARSVGVRKRKPPVEEATEEENDAQGAARSTWGSTIRTYPGSRRDGDGDLDALLSRDKGHAKSSTAADEAVTNLDRDDASSASNNDVSNKSQAPQLKKEESDDAMGIPIPPTESQLKNEDDQAAPQEKIVFKKRKTNKAIRQR